MAEYQEIEKLTSQMPNLTITTSFQSQESRPGHPEESIQEDERRESTQSGLYRFIQLYTLNPHDRRLYLTFGQPLN